MSDIVSIDIVYGEPMPPKVIFQFLLDSGWEIGCGTDSILFHPAGADLGDCELVAVEDFSLEEFINSHGPDDFITIDIRKNDFLGSFRIGKQQISIIILDAIRLGIETYLYRPVPDFSWYLERLIPLLEYTNSCGYSCNVA